MKNITILLSLALLSSLTLSQDIEYEGVTVQLPTKNKTIKTILVKRNIPDICKNIHINNKNLWQGNFAHESVPKVCKSTFIHTKGKILPISLDSEVETYGELEVLVSIKEHQRGEDILLVDGRTSQWYEYFTIPSAINVPFIYIKKSKEYEFEFDDALKSFGVKTKEDRYDFSKAKTLVIFCNASWCTQSPDMIHALLDIGYPAQKLKWYRGGMQSWVGSGMTTTLDVK